MQAANRVLEHIHHGRLAAKNLIVDYPDAITQSERKIPNTHQIVIIGSTFILFFAAFVSTVDIV